MTIKAIETVYNGYRFRSRLEARWAVFFDTLGVKYEYEPEGFHVGSKKYLPDFLLPDLDCWVECKPQNPTPDEREKLRLMTDEKYIGVILRTPDTKLNDGLGYWMKKPMGYQTFVQCLICRKIGMASFHPSDKERYFFRLRCPCQAGFTTDTPELIAAFTAARQARFEHGEKGQHAKGHMGDSR